MIRVVIVCDRALVRGGIERMLDGTPAVMVAGTAADVGEAIELAAERAAEVVVVDLSMPLVERIAAVTELCRRRGRARVLVLGGVDDPRHAQEVLEAGASGFLWKGADLEELVQALVAVQRGETYLSAQASDGDGHPAEGRAAEAVLRLSRRELEVMCSLASGMTNREIADQLGISVKTIDTHRGHVLKKLQLRNNSDITRYAIRHGFIRP